MSLGSCIKQSIVQCVKVRQKTPAQMVGTLDSESSRLCLSYSQGFGSLLLACIYLMLFVFYLLQACGWYYILYYLLGKFDEHV